MATLERRVDKLEAGYMTIEQQVSNLLTKVDMFISESRAAGERRDAEMRDMLAEMSNLGNSFRTMNITVIIGIAAMFVAVLLK